jgi:hypothetical protein
MKTRFDIHVGCRVSFQPTAFTAVSDMRLGFENFPIASHFAEALYERGFSTTRHGISHTLAQRLSRDEGS